MHRDQSLTCFGTKDPIWPKNVLWDFPLGQKSFLGRTAGSRMVAENRWSVKAKKPFLITDIIITTIYNRSVHRAFSIGPSLLTSGRKNNEVKLHSLAQGHGDLWPQQPTAAWNMAKSARVECVLTLWKVLANFKFISHNSYFFLRILSSYLIILTFFLQFWEKRVKELTLSLYLLILTSWLKSKSRQKTKDKNLS